jgi:hypothetical protein
VTKPTAKSKNTPPKERGLFDHVKHIRTIKSADYYDLLSDNEKKSFNHFMILKALSMDSSMVEICSELYKLFDKIPSKQFYKLLIDVTPKSSRFFPWIKKKHIWHSQALLDIISKHFEVSNRQSNEFVNILIQNDSGINRLIEICKLYGIDDKEIEKMIMKES